MEDPIRVLVVDDTSTYRRIVTDVLAAIPGVEVVGTAANGKIALKKIEQLQPDILTLDLEMPEMDGLELLRQLSKDNSDVASIVLSGSSKHGADATMSALELGTFDFVAKPDGGTREENVDKLKQQLRPKVEACAKRTRIHKILHGHGVPHAAAAPPAAEHDPRPIPPANGLARVDVVAIGISTGGPNALNQVLPQLPADFPVPVLIVQHMPPVFTESLAADLDTRCKIGASEAADGQPVRPGEILIAPGGKQMKVTKQNGQAFIKITDDPPENSCRPSVDYLFRSVAEIYGPNALGVIMTGMGNDGAAGCRQMNERGAAIIAQDEATCVVFGMPRQPIEERIVDHVVPLDNIAARINKLVGRGAALCR